MREAAALLLRARASTAKYEHGERANGDLGARSASASQPGLRLQRFSLVVRP